MTFVYLILAHKNPSQLARLVKHLIDGNDSVIIHVDAKTDEAPFIEALAGYENVFFCSRRISVNWGGFSIVEATVSLMETMIKNVGLSDYVHLLSGQDFPLKSHQQIKRFFCDNYHRNFISFEQLPRPDWKFGGMNRIEFDWFIDQFGFDQAKQLTKHQKPKHFIPDTIPYGGSEWWSLTLSIPEAYINETLNVFDVVPYFFEPENFDVNDSNPGLCLGCAGYGMKILLEKNHWT